MDAELMKKRIEIYRSALLDDIVPFWINHAVDRECGGFLTFLDRDGSIYGTDKPVWLQGRIAWLFAKLYNDVENNPEWIALSKHALDFLSRYCFDSDGRMFFVVTRDGRPLRKRRYLFSECFAAMAYAEYAKASGGETERRRAAEIFDLILHYLNTPGLLEPKENQNTRPSRSHAMAMILIAVAQIVRQVDARQIYDDTINQSISDILHLFCKPEMRALLETVGPNGEFIDTPEGRTVNPGHSIETAWFIMEEGLHKQDKELALKAIPILEWSLDIGWDDEFGGIRYYADVLGKPCVQYEWDMKLWWPHTEALYAALLAYHLTGDKRWSDWYEKIHDYTFSHFPDSKYGEWFGYLHRDGTVSHRLKGNLWKGPYHISRAMLLCWKLLEKMAGGC